MKFHIIQLRGSARVPSKIYSTKPDSYIHRGLAFNNYDGSNWITVAHPQGAVRSLALRGVAPPGSPQITSPTFDDWLAVSAVQIGQSGPFVLSLRFTIWAEPGMFWKGERNVRRKGEGEEGRKRGKRSSQKEFTPEGFRVRKQAPPETSGNILLMGDTPYNRDRQVIIG